MHICRGLLLYVYLTTVQWEELSVPQGENTCSECSGPHLESKLFNFLSKATG